MKLGACYNVFDAEELLEKSILSLSPNVDYVCVVYQTTSNFGNRCNPHLESLLKDLVDQKLVQDLVFYEPRNFTDAEKRALVSDRVTEKDIGGPPETVGEQFFNEMTKRELGRLKCLENGCTHFMTLDTDEFFLKDQLAYAKDLIMKKGFDSTACKMRIFFKEPIYEYYPYDEMNAVPLIHVCAPNNPFRIAQPYPILVDPTRRLKFPNNFYLFGRDEIEMYHMTFVRMSIRMKLDNVSNRQNYGDVEEFLSKYEKWTPDKGVLHPHPFIGQIFKEIRTVPNYFDIYLDRLCKVCYKSRTKRCSKCKKVWYCGPACQLADWRTGDHKQKCLPSVTQ